GVREAGAIGGWPETSAAWLRSSGPAARNDAEGQLDGAKHQGEVHARLLEPRRGDHGRKEREVDEAHLRRVWLLPHGVARRVERLGTEGGAGCGRGVSGRPLGGERA